MRLLLTANYVIALAMVLSCSPSPDGTTRSDRAPRDDQQANVRGDAKGLDGGAASSVSASAPEQAAQPLVRTFERAIGPISLAPGDEKTLCTTMRLGNADAVFVPHIGLTLAPGSHHLIVYRSKATDENATPSPCQAFQGIVGGGEVPLVLSQRHEDELAFPPGVALKLLPRQIITLEAHYINTTNDVVEGRGTVRFDTLPVGTQSVMESDLAFWGPLFSIHVPAHATATTPVLFQSGLAGTKGFAVSTHQHRLGTRFRIWFAGDATDIDHPPIADNSDWADPPLIHVKPELQFDGKNGLAFQCEWQNPTDQDIGFGESALQEMCFLWMYYYPSQGFDMRLLP